MVRTVLQIIYTKIIFFGEPTLWTRIKIDGWGYQGEVGEEAPPGRPGKQGPEGPPGIYDESVRNKKIQSKSYI